MKRKSKFLVFILSAVPGLSHLYLGCQERALVLFMTFLGICFGGAAIGNLGFMLDGVMVPLIFFIAILVWFTALAEAMKLANALPAAGAGDVGEDSGGAEPEFLISSRRLMTLGFSVIPGAGHMFLGLIKPGVQLMTAFFLVLVLGNWMELGLLGFLAPVIWFLGIFDAYHQLEDEEMATGRSDLFEWLKNHSQYVGWGLIILGLLIIVQRLGSPILGWQHWLTPALRNLIQTGFVALLLIAGGIKLIAGGKTRVEGEDEI